MDSSAHSKPLPVDETRCVLAEGVLWDSRTQRLLWIDIEGNVLFARQDGITKKFVLDSCPGTVALTENEELVLLALKTGLFLLDLRTGDTEFFAPFPNSGDQAELRFNDGKPDPTGHLWVGTMHLDGLEGRGSLYWFAGETELWEARVSSTTVSNGLAWSSDGGTFFYTDSPTRRIRAFDFDGRTGTLSRERTVVSIPEGWGYPDGFTIDSEDKLWVAHWAGGRVVRYDPESGDPMEVIEVGVPQVTSCTFGGPDLRTLYISTAQGSRDAGYVDLERYPLSGAVFEVRTSVEGTKSHPFLRPAGRKS